MSRIFSISVQPRIPGEPDCRSRSFWSCGRVGGPQHYQDRLVVGRRTPDVARSIGMRALMAPAKFTFFRVNT